MVIVDNPFTNPLFFPSLVRLVLLLVIGLILSLALVKFNLRRFFSSEIGKRYLGWLLIIPIYLASIYFAGRVAELIILTILSLGIWEVARVSKLPKPYQLGLYTLALISVIQASFFPHSVALLPILYFSVFTVTGIRENKAQSSFSNAATAIFVSIWLIFSLSHFILLNDLNLSLDGTRALLMLIGFAVPLSDVGAYLLGKLFVRFHIFDHYIVADQISPRKTYIGVLGNIIGAWLGIAIMYFAVKSYLPWYHWVIIGIIIGIFGLIGDLTESMFKRQFNVKDSSNLIPGHGGILDRLDSTLRVVLVLYYYLLLVL